MSASPAPLLRPQRWRMPPAAAETPHLHAQGWSVPGRGHCPRAFTDALARAAGVTPSRLEGSRVGRLWPLRAVLLALGQDLLLEPAVRAADRFSITPAAAERMAARGRAALQADPQLRAELGPLLRELLGIRVPEGPPARPGP